MRSVEDCTSALQDHERMGQRITGPHAPPHAPPHARLATAGCATATGLSLAFLPGRTFSSIRRMPKRFGLDCAGKGGGGKGGGGLPPPPPPPPSATCSAAGSAAGSAAARVAVGLAVASPALGAAVIAGEVKSRSSYPETRIPGAEGKGGMAVRGGGDGPAGGGTTAAPVRERLRASGT